MCETCAGLSADNFDYILLGISDCTVIQEPIIKNGVDGLSYIKQCRPEWVTLLEAKMGFENVSSNL